MDIKKLNEVGIEIVPVIIEQAPIANNLVNVTFAVPMKAFKLLLPYVLDISGRGREFTITLNPCFKPLDAVMADLRVRIQDIAQAALDNYGKPE